MAKVSFASKDAYEPKIGFQEGWFEIAEAKTQVFQYPPNKDSGEQVPPFLAAVISFQKTDEQGNPLEEEPQDRVLRIEKDLGKMRPGNASSREDDDPSDMGDELETEGNCVFTEAGAKINVNSAWMVFVKSLEEKGFKAEVLGQGYLPDLVGTKGHAISTKGEKRQINGRDVEPSYLVIDKLTVKPYEKSNTATKKAAGKAASNSGAAAAAVNGKPNGAAKASPKAAPDSEGAEEVATDLLRSLSSDLAGQTRDAAKVYAMAYSRLMKDKTRDKSLDKPVQDLLRNNDWLNEKGIELELFTVEDNVFAFNESVAA